MNTRAKLKPGQKGTKKLLAQYGDSLVCVRYRYDVEKRRQVKTVELIVSETDWTPPPPKYPESALVPLKVGGDRKVIARAGEVFRRAMGSGAEGLVREVRAYRWYEAGKVNSSRNQEEQCEIDKVYNNRNNGGL